MNKIQKIKEALRPIVSEIVKKIINESKLMFVKDKNIPYISKKYGLSFQEILDYEQSLISKSVLELRKLQSIVSQQQDRLRKTKSLTPQQEKAQKQLEFRDLMLRAAVDYVAFEK